MLFYSFWALAGFVSGVCLLYNFNILFTCAVAAAAVIFTLVKPLRTRLKKLFVFGLFAVLGCCIMYMHSVTSSYTGEYVTVSGRISEIPYQNGDTYCYIVSTRSITRKDNVYPLKCRLNVYSKNKYSLDDCIDAAGFLELHTTAKNPGCFNSRLYYRSVSVSYKLTAIEDSISSYKIKSNSFYSFCVRARSKICEYTDKYFRPENAVLLKYILADFRKGIDSDYSESLLNSGVKRCLYSPYYHAVLMLFLVSLLLKRTNANVKRMLICILCVLYLLANPYNPVGQKLFVLIFLTAFLSSHLKIYRFLDVLWLSVLICCMKNPYILYNTGFLMSVVSTLIINRFYSRLYCIFIRFQRNGAVVRIAVLYFIFCFLTLPVSALLFNGISLYSILVSVVLMPVILSIYVLSPLLYLFYLFGMKGVVGVFIESLVAFIRNLAPAVEALPFSKLFMVRPPLVFIAAFYLLVAYLKDRRRRYFLSACIGLVLALSLNYAMSIGSMNITFINVGQGDSSLVHIPAKCTLLVDGGGAPEYNNSYDVGEREVIPYLRYRRIRSIDYIFVSHYHKDHVDGIISLMKNMKVRNIFLPDCLPENKYRGIIEETAKRHNIKIHYITKPGTIRLKQGVLAEILYFDGRATEENDTSLVVRLECNGISCLYTGDITKECEKRIIESGADLKSDILKVPHHGSEGSSSMEFIKAVAPKIAVVSLAKDNSYGFPAKTVLENYENCSVPLIRTDTDGCIEFTQDLISRRLTWQRKMR